MIKSYRKPCACGISMWMMLNENGKYQPFDPNRADGTVNLQSPHHVTCANRRQWQRGRRPQPQLSLRGLDMAEAAQFVSGGKQATRRRSRAELLNSGELDHED